MTAPVLAFRVTGIPVTQGSMSAFIAGGRAIVTDQKRKTLKPWREAIRSTAVEATGGEANRDWRPITGPLKVSLLFALPRPASAPKRTRTWPVKTRSGDIDKLARAVLDAMSEACIYGDDSQVVDLRAIKDFPGSAIGMHVPGVTVAVYRIEGDGPTTGQIPIIDTTPGGTAP